MKATENPGEIFFIGFSPSPRLFVPLSVFLWLVLVAVAAQAQSGRTPTSGRRTTVLHVVAQRVEDPQAKSKTSRPSRFTPDDGIVVE